MNNKTINCYVAAVSLAFVAITTLISNSGSWHGFAALCYGTISLSFFFILISIGSENKKRLENNFIKSIIEEGRNNQLMRQCQHS